MLTVKLFAVAALVLAISAGVAYAAPVTTFGPDVEGVYRYTDKGSKVGVGYRPCGTPVLTEDGTFVLDTSLVFVAEIRRSQSLFDYRAATVDELVAQVETIRYGHFYGLTLSEEAVAVLEAAAATYVCME